MNSSQKTGSVIAEQAEVELWESLRSEIRRRLFVAVSVGAFYMLVASMVGMFLIHTLATMNDESVFLLTWSGDALNTTTMNPILWAYACLAVAVIVGYGVSMLLIGGLLPANLCAIVGSLPWIGSTMRIVSMGEFCQSIYQSVLAVKSYPEAFATASESVRNADLRRWLKLSAKRIEYGFPIEHVIDDFADSGSTADGGHRLYRRGACRRERCDHLEAGVGGVSSARAIETQSGGVDDFDIQCAGCGTACNDRDVLVGNVYESVDRRTRLLMSFAVNLLGFAAFLALVAAMVHAIKRNLICVPAERVSFVAYGVFDVVGILLWIACGLSVITALPHPSTVLFVSLILVSLVTASSLRYREEVRSLNRWMQMATGVRTPLPELLDRFGSGCRSRLAVRVKGCVRRLRLGETVVDAVRHSRLDLEIDTMATLSIPRPSGEGSGNLSSLYPQYGRYVDVDVDVDEEYESSKSQSLHVQQFTYVVVTLLLARLISGDGSNRRHPDRRRVVRR